jgi:hypothetical protein
MDTKTQKPTISAATWALLQALREVEAARSHYYECFEATMGEQAAGEMLEKANAKFDTAAAVIETEIFDAVKTWATSEPIPAEI